MRHPQLHSTLNSLRLSRSLLRSRYLVDGRHLLRLSVRKTPLRDQLGQNDLQTHKVLRVYLPSKFIESQNATVPEEAKDFIKKILVLDPKLRMTTKEMLQHPFLTNEDVPKTLTV